MTVFQGLLFITICAIVSVFFFEFTLSILHKKYKGYHKITHVITFWLWLHDEWSYIDGYPPVRHIGVRWFGFEFEKNYEIPMKIIK